MNPLHSLILFSMSQMQKELVNVAIIGFNGIYSGGALTGLSLQCFPLFFSIFSIGGRREEASFANDK